MFLSKIKRVRPWWGQLLWPSHSRILFASWCQEWQSSINGESLASRSKVVWHRRAEQCLQSSGDLDQLLPLTSLAFRTCCFVHNTDVLVPLRSWSVNTPWDDAAGPDGSKGVSECSARPISSVTKTVWRPLEGDSSTRAWPCTCIRWQITAGVPRWPCYLSLLTKTYANSTLYGIYQMDQDNKNSKFQRRHPFFFFLLYTSWALDYYSHLSFITLIDRMHFHQRTAWLNMWTACWSS